MTRAQTALLFVLVSVAALAHAWLYAVPFEDSFITFRYARNLADGFGVAYNPGERVEGCTSLGWVVLLAAAAKAGFSLPNIGLVLSLGFGVALVVLTARLAQRCLPELGPWAFAAALLVAAHGTFAYYAASAMETTLFALLINAALLLLATGAPRAPIIAGVLLALAATVRPEGPGYFAIMCIALAVRARLWSAGAQPAERREVLAFAAAFLVLFVPFFVWRYAYFGYPFPNTFYAKARVGLTGLVSGFEHTEEFMTLGLFWLAPLGLYQLRKTERATRFYWLSSAVVLGAATNLVFIGGDSFAFYRVFMPALPAGAVLTLGGLHRLYQDHRERISPARALAVVAGVVLFVFGASWLPRWTLISNRDGSNREIVVSVDEVNRDYFRIGRWLALTFPKRTVIATNAAGIIPYESGMKTIDMLGLNDVHIAHHEVSGQGAIGHQKHDATYVLGKRPEVILPVIPILTPNQLGPQELVGSIEHWFASLPGDRELFDHPNLARDYLLVTRPVEPHRWVVLYLRKDAAK